MKIETTKFKNALSIVKPALASKEIIEQTTSFAFVDNKVITYNDEICIVHPFENLEIEGVIQADELYKFLGKVKEKEFDVTVSDSEIVMKAGRSKVGFALNKEILLPLNEEIAEKSKWRKLPEDFARACKFAVASASVDMSDEKLTCVHFNKSRVEATNNYRLVVWNFSEELPMPVTLIPASSIKEVLKLKPTKVATGKGWIHFENTEKTVISCRLVSETFVDTESVIKSIKRGKKITFPDGLVSILDKAEVFSQEQKTDNSVAISIQNGKLLVKSESLTAWFKETIACETEEDFSFDIAPYLLKDILKETTTCTISGNALLFKSENWVYLTALKIQN
jgi:DNA polymerase III sliding clamp (beta) subunit (PCNA family)